MNLNITYYFLLFFIYSVAGWILEVTCKLIDSKKFINRGFLIGPYCPIYGAGAVLITYFLYKYEYDPVILFMMTAVICGMLEYSTSYIMEKLFKARWWDYSKRKFNLDGRICLGTIVPFGIFGVILTYATNPFLIEQINKINIFYINAISIALLLIVIIDVTISTILIFNFRKTTIQVSTQGRQDNTEQITSKVREILLARSWVYRRLIEAFPNLQTIKFRIQEITEEVKESAKELKDNINEKAEDIKNTIYYKKDEVMTTINEKTKEMKNNFADTKNVIKNEFAYRKRKIRVTFNLNKRKFKKVFIGNNTNSTKSRLKS